MHAFRQYMPCFELFGVPWIMCFCAWIYTMCNPLTALSSASQHNLLRVVDLSLINCHTTFLNLLPLLACMCKIVWDVQSTHLVVVGRWIIHPLSMYTCHHWNISSYFKLIHWASKFHNVHLHDIVANATFPPSNLFF